mgnify:CR=1 FL=1
MPDDGIYDVRQASSTRGARFGRDGENARVGMREHSLYARFFGLAERPFTLTPDPGYLFWSGQHRRAFSVLEYGIMAQVPITLLTGEVGSGKTTLVQELLKKIDAEITVGLISNAQGGRGELLQWILNALGVAIDAQASYVQLFQALQDFLVGEYAEGRRVVLVIDEAQNLSMEGLEELRMLTNINANKDDLVQLVLVGQPELRAMVESPQLRQLAQRVAASYHLGAMDQDTVQDYIAHRLRCAGGQGTEFTPAAGRAIFAASRGVPRLVNQLCEFAMLYAWSAEARSIDEEIVATVLADGVFFAGCLPEESDAR